MLFNEFSAVNAKILIVSNTRRQPLAYLTPHYHCRGPRVQVACFQKDHQLPVGTGWCYTYILYEIMQHKHVSATRVDMDE